MGRTLRLEELLREHRLGGVGLGMSPREVRRAWGERTITERAARGRPGRYTQLVPCTIGAVALSFDDRMVLLRTLTIDLRDPAGLAEFLRVAGFEAIDRWVLAAPLPHSALASALAAAGIGFTIAPRRHASALDYLDQATFQIDHGPARRLRTCFTNEAGGVASIRVFDGDIDCDDFTTEGPAGFEG